MQERKVGCICELNSETGEPIVANYAECPVHKPDAITPKDTANDIFMDYFDDCTKEHAKWCAAKCVDHILSVLGTFQTHEYAKVLIPYYTEVKNEINKL
jgi:hypothetical protein